MENKETLTIKNEIPAFVDVICQRGQGYYIKKSIQKVILILSFVYVTFGCTQTDKKISADDDSSSANSADPGKNYHWTIDPNVFGIESISEGYDSLQIRIWYMPSYTPVEVPVVTIKRTEGKWIGTIRCVYLNFVSDSSNGRKNGEILVPFEIRSKNISPKSNWMVLINKMRDLKIFTLPDMHDIPNLNDGVLDGQSYIVEIAKANYYRTYSYHVPENFANNFWQAQNIVDILDLVDTELGFPWNWDRDQERLKRTAAEFNMTADTVIIKR